MFVEMQPGQPPAPGLLLEWEKRDDGWYGHVWLLAKQHAHVVGWDEVREAWIPASRLSPDRPRD